MISANYAPTKNSLLSPIALIVIFALTSLAASLLLGQHTAKATLSGFSAGNIMSNEVMGNKSTMSESQIQSFLKSKNSCNDRNLDRLTSYNSKEGYIKAGSKTFYYNLKDGHFVCMADESFNGESAARIIWRAAQDYDVNPQVLIVLLQKEQALVTDTWPNRNYQYAAATGYDCPDSGSGCNNANAGFKTQVRKAAALFREVLNGGWSNYPVGNNYIQYNPDKSCGGSTVNIKNRATSSLYRYTPYQPNSGALAAGWGEAHCGAYGNRNFYNYFTSWFGDTKYTIKGAIKRYYDSYGGKTKLGQPIQNEVFAGNDTWYQCFQHGCIVGSSATGFWESKGAIRDRWGKLGYINSTIGLPTGPETYDSKAESWSQKYQNGAIIGTAGTGFWESIGDTRTRWAQLGYQSGTMGYPTGPVTQTGAGSFQKYQNGYIIGTSSTGYWESKGAIRERWAELGYQNGALGYPAGSEVYAGGGIYYQKYEKGYIIGKSSSGFWESYGPTRTRWAELGYQNGPMGYPTGPITPTGSGFFQKYQNGYIIGTSSTGYWESKGAIRKHWGQQGYQNGALGYPTGPEQYTTATRTYHQQYEHNKIFHKPPSTSWIAP